MTIGLVGRKVGMTRIFTDDGVSVPVTVLDVSNNRVAQIKTEQADGYVAVQLAYGVRRNSRVTKAEAGHFAKAGIGAAAALCEFRMEDVAAYAPGAAVGADVFQAGQLVDVSGVTQGKGFAGTIKRHNFRSQRATHGNSRSHNVPGSIGQAQDPGRVFPGKRMAGHMGAVQCTAQNLEVVRVDAERGLLLVKGAVPGARGGEIVVRAAAKGGK
jgi:large subunit ribosomal protein L3